MQSPGYCSFYSFVVFSWLFLPGIFQMSVLETYHQSEPPSQPGDVPLMLLALYHNHRERHMKPDIRQVEWYFLLWRYKVWIACNVGAEICKHQWRCTHGAAFTDSTSHVFPEGCWTYMPDPPFWAHMPGSTKSMNNWHRVLAAWGWPRR